MQNCAWLDKWKLFLLDQQKSLHHTIQSLAIEYSLYVRHGASHCEITTDWFIQPNFWVLFFLYARHHTVCLSIQTFKSLDKISTLCEIPSYESVFLNSCNNPDAKNFGNKWKYKEGQNLALPRTGFQQLGMAQGRPFWHFCLSLSFFESHL